MSGNRSSLKRASKLPNRFTDFEVDKTGDFGMGEKEAEIDKSKRLLEMMRKKRSSGTPKKTSRAVPVPSASSLYRQGRGKKATAGALTSAVSASASGPSVVAKSKAQPPPPPPSSSRKQNRQPVARVVESSDEDSTDQEKDLKDSDDEDFVPGTVKATRAVPVSSDSSLFRRGQPKKATAEAPTSLNATTATGPSKIVKFKAQPPPSSAKKRAYQPMADDVESSEEESYDQERDSEKTDDDDIADEQRDSNDEDFVPRTVKATRAVPVPSASSHRRPGRPKEATAGVLKSSKTPAARGPSALTKSNAQPPPSFTKKRASQPMARNFESSDEETSDQERDSEDTDSEDSTDYDDSNDEDFEPGKVSSDSEDEPAAPKAPRQPVSQARPSATAQAISARTHQATSQRLTLNAPTVQRAPRVSSNSNNQEPPPKQQRIFVPISSCPPEVAAFLKKNSNVYKMSTTNVRPLKVRSASEKDDGERGFVADQELSDSTLTNSRSDNTSQDSASNSRPLTTTSFVSNRSRTLPYVPRNTHTRSYSPQEPDFDDYGGSEHHMDLDYNYIPSDQEEQEFDDQDVMENEPEEQQPNDTWTSESHSLLEQGHDVEDNLFGDEASPGEDNGDAIVKAVASTPIAPLQSSSGTSGQPANYHKKTFEVDVVPKRMFFNAPFDKTLRNSMLLKNNSDHWLVYKISFSNPERHSIKHPEGRIQPNKTREVTVLCASFDAMEASDEDQVYEVIVKFVKIPKGEWQVDDAWFEDEKIEGTWITEIRHSN